MGWVVDSGMRIINAILTPRGLAALALCGLVLVFSYLSDIFEFIFYILVFIMIAALLADIALAPGPRAFKITRRFDTRMSLLEDNPVELEITCYFSMPKSRLLCAWWQAVRRSSGRPLLPHPDRQTGCCRRRQPRSLPGA